MEAASPANRFNLNEQFRGPVQIIGLPDDLKDVPPSPSGPDDPDRVAKRVAWAEWTFRLRVYRTKKFEEVKDSQTLQKVEWHRCKNDPAYFIAMYAHIYEPRKNKGRGGYNPWIPFERQVQMIRWFQYCMEADDEHSDGVLSKCRDVGASWLMCGLFLHQWLFEETFNGLLVSWKEDFVDSRAPKSLFWKIDRLMDPRNLPAFLRPSGYDPEKHRIKLFMQNPVTGSTIGGESTTSKSARGDRATAVLYDEAAFIPDFMNIWMGSADSTDHRFGISTESLQEGTGWVDLRQGTNSDYSPAVMTIDWWEYPLHDDDWFHVREKRAGADPDSFRREILRDPYTSSQFVYPLMREKFPLPGLEYEPGNPLFVMIDPGFDDNCAIAWVQYNIREARYEVLNGYTNNKEIADFYGPLLAGTETNDRGEVSDYRYTPYEYEIMEWVDAIGGRSAKFIGDMYGDHRNGASADTWYSVWQRDYGIIVNRDRLPNNRVAAHRMQARTMDGRRKALRWITPKLEFADTIGARKVLLALQNNSFTQSRNGRIPEGGMFRDGTTHFTSAVEYWAANMYMQDQLTAYVEQQNSWAEEAEKDVIERGPRWSNRSIA